MSGLLIEPSRDYDTLIKKNRKVNSLNVCLATKKHPHMVQFYNYDMIGGIKGKYREKCLSLRIHLMMPPFKHLQMYLLCFLGQIGGWAKNEVLSNAQVINVTCIPLYTILLAMGNPTVDFFLSRCRGCRIRYFENNSVA